MDLQIITISLIPFYKGHLGGNCSHGSWRIAAIILWEMPLEKTVGQLTKIQLPPRRLRPLRFSGGVRIRENSLTLFLFFPFLLSFPIFSLFLSFLPLGRSIFLGKLGLMLNFILNPVIKNWLFIPPFVFCMSRKRVSRRNPFSVHYSTDLKIR